MTPWERSEREKREVCVLGAGGWGVGGRSENGEKEGLGSLGINLVGIP